MTLTQFEEILMNTDIDIVTITRVLADGSHVSLGDSTSTIEQLVAALDTMTRGREIVDDIFTHQTITVMDDEGGASPKVVPIKKPVKKTRQIDPYLSNRFLVF
jgi:hypothetical protein